MRNTKCDALHLPPSSCSSFFGGLTLAFSVYLGFINIFIEDTFKNLAEENSFGEG